MSEDDKGFCLVRLDNHAGIWKKVGVPSNTEKYYFQGMVTYVNHKPQAELYGPYLTIEEAVENQQKFISSL